MIPYHTLNARKPHTRLLGSALVMALISAGLVFGFLSPVAHAQTTVNVSIQGYAFNPDSITVVIGVNNTVTWTNNMAVSHTVTADGGAFNGAVAPGKTFTYTFTTPGTFPYHCSIHTYMTGTVTVVGSGSTTTSTSSSTSTGSATTSSSASSSVTSTSSSASSTSSTVVSTPPSSTTVSTPTATTTSSGATSSFVTSPTTTNSSGSAGYGVPEFPVQVIGVLALTLIVIASYLALRQSRKER